MSNPMQSTAERLSELAFLESRRLEHDPNIVVVGCGVKLRCGRPTGTLCLQYFVERKPRRGAAETWHNPPELDGVPTDVVEVGAIAR